MSIDELRIAIATDIEETKEYSEFMKVQMKPMLTAVGRSHMEHLHFFNLGYQFAMEKVEHLLETVDVD